MCMKRAGDDKVDEMFCGGQLDRPIRMLIVVTLSLEFLRSVVYQSLNAAQQMTMLSSECINYVKQFIVWAA